MIEEWGYESHLPCLVVAKGQFDLQMVLNDDKIHCSWFSLHYHYDLTNLQLKFLKYSLYVTIFILASYKFSQMYTHVL